LSREAEHLSIHAPLTEGTRGIIDADTLERPSEQGVLGNSGRGGIVDATALLDHPDRVSIAAARLDVLVEDPPSDWSVQKPSERS
jgi:D-3-phosphoglycerate dehydrogenase